LDWRLNIRNIALGVILLGTGIASPAQTSQPPQAPPSAAKSIGMFTSPKNGQNAEQQPMDENECYTSARQPSGGDPLARPPAAKSADQKEAEQRAAVDNAKSAKGGGLEELLGGQQPEAQSEPLQEGKGAAAGTLKGGMQQRPANAATKQQAVANTAAQQQQQEAQANAAHAQNLDAFKRAFSACMDARGCSVK